MNLQELKHDAITWKTNYLISLAKGDVHKRNDAIDSISNTLSFIESEYRRDVYIKDIAKIFNAKTKYIADLVSSIKTKRIKKETPDEVDEGVSYKFPSFINADKQQELLNYGFTMVYKENDRKATGIWMLGKNTVEAVSNFTIEPLFHVWSQNINENKKLFVVKNAYETAVLDFETAATISVDRFSATINAKHNFMWMGNIIQLKKLMEHLGYNVKRCEEIKILGWQPEGFFAYTDKYLSNGDIVNLSEYGIGEHNSRLYFSPSQSILYKDARSDDNVYETLDFLKFHESPVDFSEWAKLMCDTYPDNGKYAVIFVFVSLFRDLVLRIDGSCPHLYVWGSPGSGKSKMMESLTSFFYSSRRSFSLNSGTDFALSRYMQVFRNCFHFLNELDETTVKPQWIQWLKGAYDNEGRERGKGGSKNMTEVMKVNSTLGLAGQKILTIDDNALPMRCIIRGFKSLENKNIPEKQMKAYDRLKKLEDAGGFNSLISEILKHRSFFAIEYGDTFNKVFKDIRKSIENSNYKWNERIGRNYSYLLTMCKLASEKFILPFTYQSMFNEVVEQINEITAMITSSDATSEFWRIISMLADQGKIERGLHYEIETTSGELHLYENKKVLLPNETRLLYFRIGVCHSLYKESYRRETGREGMNLKSLLSYLESREYFMGSHNSRRFQGMVPGTKQIRSTVTSCHVFDYDKMEKAGIFLDYITESHAHSPSMPAQEVKATNQEDLPF